ncbi:MAG: hypothetical protein HY879_03660 [Deltaproteobacteria bacterium]|nr:hypothetical protein [Deltaproteobacteria bacterium]
MTLVWVALFLGAGTVSVISYSAAKVLADQVSMAGSAHRFPLEFFEGIQRQARWTVVFLALIGIVFFILRRKIQQNLEELIPSQTGLRNLMDFSSFSRIEMAGLLVLIVIGFYLRLVQMKGIVTYDEAFTYFQYAQNPLTAVTVYTHVNNHIFHTLLISIITIFFGGSIWAFRSVAFIAGLLLIPIVFGVARSRQPGASTLTGWLAATIVSVNPLVVQYSAMARGYTLQALIALLTWGLFVRIYQGDRTLVFMLGVLCSLSLWTIPTSSFLLVGLGFAFLFGFFEKRIKMNALLNFLLITGIFSAIFWGPAIIVSGLKAFLMNPDVNPVTGGGTVDPFFERFRYLKGPLSLHSGGSAGVGVVGLLTLWGLSAAPNPWRWLGMGIFLSIISLIALVQVTPPPRTCVFLVPLIALLVDFGLCNISKLWQKRRKRAEVIVGVLAIFYILTVFPIPLQYEGPGHKEVSDFAKVVASQWTPGQTIMIQPETTRMLQPISGSLYHWYNAYTVRFYLERAGIPESAFHWRRKGPSYRGVWLISVQVDGKPMDLQGPEGKKFTWDLIMGPYSLAKKVPKSQIPD